MKKALSVVIVLMIIFTCIIGCCEDPIKVIAMKGPTGMGVVWLDDEKYEDVISLEYVASAEEAKVEFVSGNADVVCLPTNMAAALYAKLPEDNVRLLALNTLGVLYIVENGDTVHSLQDLEGKTLYVTGQGSTPEYVIRWILEKKNLSDKVDLEFVDDHDTLATMAAAGMVKLAMLPEPKVTTALMNSADLHVALDVTELYDETAEAEGTDAVLSMGCLLTKQNVIEEHTDEIVTFMEAYRNSVERANESIDESAERMAEKGIIPKAPVAVNAIPRCHMVFITGEEMKKQIAPFFEMLYQSDPKSTGGSLPGDDLYYIP